MFNLYGVIEFINFKTFLMGKGDKKSRRGKIVNGSYGVKRPRHKYYYEDDTVEEKATKKAK